MKRFILSVLAVFAITAVVVGCGSSNTSSSSNTELQGTWTQTMTEPCDTPPCDTYTRTLTFSGNNWTITLPSLDTMTGPVGREMSGTFTFNSAADPKTIDLYIAAYPGGDFVGQTILNIYQLSGTNLTIVFGEEVNGEDTRPTSFTSDNTANFIKQ